MHLGNARTALLAWLQARAAGGRVALRIDDLDVERCRPEHAASVVDDLAWLGLDWDGEVLVQSTRSAAYDAAIADLDARGLVYECFCTRAELRALASAPHDASELGPPYPGTCRELTRRRARRPPRRRPRRRAAPARAAGARALRRPAARRAGRGRRGGRRLPAAAHRRAARLRRWRPSWTTRRRASRTCCAATTCSRRPAARCCCSGCSARRRRRYCHVPLLYGPDGARLAKRHGAVAVRDLRAAGVPAAAVTGWLAATAGLAGHGERVAPDALVDRFDVERLRGAAATVEASAARGAPRRRGGRAGRPRRVGRPARPSRPRAAAAARARGRRRAPPSPG